MDGTGERPRCRNHLGVDPRIVKAKADADRLAVTLWRQQDDTRRRHGIRVDEEIESFDVLGELITLAVRARQWMQVCEALVSNANEVRYRAGNGENVRGEVTLYTAAVRDLGRLLTDLAKIMPPGEAERRHQRAADRTVHTLDSVLSRLGLDPYAPSVASVVESVLREIDGEAAS